MVTKCDTGTFRWYRTAEYLYIAKWSGARFSLHFILSTTIETQRDVTIHIPLRSLSSSTTNCCVKRTGWSILLPCRPSVSKADSSRNSSTPPIPRQKRTPAVCAGHRPGPHLKGRGGNPRRPHIFCKCSPAAHGAVSFFLLPAPNRGERHLQTVGKSRLCIPMVLSDICQPFSDHRHHLTPSV